MKWLCVDWQEHKNAHITEKNHQIKGFPYSADLNMKDEIKGIKNINKNINVGINIKNVVYCEQTCDKMFYFCLFIRGNRA